MLRLQDIQPTNLSVSGLEGSYRYQKKKKLGFKEFSQLVVLHSTDTGLIGILRMERQLAFQSFHYMHHRRRRLRQYSFSPLPSMARDEATWESA